VADLPFGRRIVRRVKLVVPTSPKIGEKWGTRPARGFSRPFGADVPSSGAVPALETPGYLSVIPPSVSLGKLYEALFLSLSLPGAWVLGCIISRFAADLSFGLSIVRPGEVRRVVPTSPKIREKWGTRQVGAR
jgi:hypothetical protein